MSGVVIRTQRSRSRVLADVDLSHYDYVDLGCARGDSMRFSANRFGGGRGLGVDVDPAKLRAARRRGLDVVYGDVTDLTGEGAVRFVSMSHLLEHLESHAAVETVLRNAGRLANDFLYIRHPSFDDEAYLAGLGLRFYFHHWSGHPSHVTTEEFMVMFERLGFDQFQIRPLGIATDSTDPNVIPIGLPKNQRHYSSRHHGPKPQVPFAHPVHSHLEIFVALRPFEPAEWRALVALPSARPDS